MSVVNSSRFDTIVVGSGPGGGTVAKELVQRGHKVLVLEWGNNNPLKGTLAQMAGIAAVPGKGAFILKDASLVMRGITAGGSSAINYATAMPPPASLFAAYGIDLSQEVTETRQELPIGPLPDRLIGPMAKQIMNSARALGLNWQKLDKMIYTEKCRTNCWRCTYGCPYGAKWHAGMYLEQALENGAELIIESKVHRVLIKDNNAIGVEYYQHGVKHQVFAKNVVLSAGGISSPQILTESGISHAGEDFFVDPVVAVMGSIKGLDGGREIPMTSGLHMVDDGIMLADMTLPKPLYQAFSAQVGRVDRLFSHKSTLTIMVKIKDQLGGRIGKRWLNKNLSAQDHEKLTKGIGVAKEVLARAGAEHIFKSRHFAAHPGGSAKINEVVDSNLKTDINGLYVCDASVIPQAWGLPPTYTLICLGKRLAKHLNAV